MQPINNATAVRRRGTAMAQQMVERIREAEARAEETLRGVQRQAAQRLEDLLNRELFAEE